MDAVILAAGRGERLDGITAPFHKPLLVINGAPLVKTAAELAHRCGATRVIVVVAPENAAPINHVLPEYVSMTVQRFPRGPGAALGVAMQQCYEDEVLVLMGDNITTYGDVHKVAKTQGNAVGIQLMPAEDAERYTRVRVRSDPDAPGKPEWVEKISVTEDDLREHGMATCWIGPIKVNRKQMWDALAHWRSLDTGVAECPIGPLFNELQDITLVPVTSVDIGVPEMMP